MSKLNTSWRVLFKEVHAVCQIRQIAHLIMKPQLSFDKTTADHITFRQNIILINQTTVVLVYIHCLVKLFTPVELLHILSRFNNKPQCVVFGCYTSDATKHCELDWE